MTDAAGAYASRYESHLVSIAESLQEFVRDQLRGVLNIDHIVARAKAPERFAEKAQRVTDDGQPKYSSPLAQIQDQLGVRVGVLFLGDIQSVVQRLDTFFAAIEERTLVPESHREFGYFGRHLVLVLPRDVVPSGVADDLVPRFFEAQIKTLFQYAWSEAEHDLGYKSKTGVTPDQERLFAYAAAQSWGADRIFDELRREML